MAAVTEWVTWRTAMERALYGPDGFYRRPGAGPAAHFRTSAHNPVFAEAVARLLLRVDERLGSPERLDFVDMAAGRGELAAGVVRWLAAEAPEAAGRLRTVAVDLGPRPEGLPEAVEWTTEAPSNVVGLLFANEWLDNVVCDVAEVGADGDARIVEVEVEVEVGAGSEAGIGQERLGAAPDAEQREWLARWWPMDRTPGTRAEIGLDRDAAWRAAVARLERGVAVAVDYSHTAADRPRFGTLTGYRDGHQVPAVPDGSCDITAHVALDACAAALDPGVQTLLTTQRDFLRDLGVSGARPDLALASSDPLGYLRGLSRASAAAELTDPAGLGAFGWLVAFSSC
ncbi:SAM-dependent MidA family methyltransferase [Catenulispora sp. GP43]|uniref:SAM-dependent methyltransferase n=1 Tax=Catenulispora sp. GP43 TaxID=3156263 RepID=UPI003518E6E0